MDPITIALGLASIIPSVLKWMGHSNAAESAQKIVAIAQQVTGKGNGEDALAAVQNDPTLALKLQQELDRHEEELNKTTQDVTLAEIKADSDNVKATNETMQVEAKSEHWQVYSWRPYVGFCFGSVFIIVSLVVMMAFASVIFGTAKVEVLQYIGQLITSMATLMAIPLPILGVASWFRGKMQVQQGQVNDTKK